MTLSQKKELLHLWLVFVRAFNAYLKERGLPTVDYDPDQKRDKDGKFSKIGTVSVNATRFLSPKENETGTKRRTEALKKELSEAIKMARNFPNERRKVVVGNASTELISKAKKAGIDIAGYVHDVDVSGIRHAIIQHGNRKTEIPRGQLAITDDDILKIPEIIGSYDNVDFPGKNRSGLDTVVYTKSMDDGTVYFYEEIRTGKKTLTFLTMYKKQKNES